MPKKVDRSCELVMLCRDGSELSERGSFEYIRQKFLDMIQLDFEFGFTELVKMFIVSGTHVRNVYVTNKFKHVSIATYDLTL